MGFVYIKSLRDYAQYPGTMSKFSSTIHSTKMVLHLMQQEDKFLATSKHFNANIVEDCTTRSSSFLTSITLFTHTLYTG